MTARAEEFWTALPKGPVRAAAKPLTTDDFRNIFKKASPAVVNISIAQTDALAAKSQVEDQPKSFTGFGTGFIIHPSGYVVTNHHVVERAKAIVATLSDQRQLDARLIGMDESTDLAVLKLESPAPFPVIPLASDDSVEIGDWTIAIGNPFGLNSSMTVGILSSKGRREINDDRRKRIYDYFLQTDAAINPGNSGGPLINLRGEVIGINTAIKTDAQNIGFAVPIEMIKAIIPQLVKNGRVTRGWIGIRIDAVTAETAYAVGLSKPTGTLVTGLDATSPAAEAGLQSQDVILEYDHHAVQSAGELAWWVANTPAGKTVPLKVLRKGRHLAFLVTAGTKEPTSPEPTVLGMTLEPVDAELARQLKWSDPHGMVITRITPGSQAAGAGLLPGDVLVTLEDVPIAQISELQAALNVPHRKVAKFQVRRGKASWLVFIP